MGKNTETSLNTETILNGKTW